MINKMVFVTGTDTDVGKTVISCALINYFLSRNKSVAPFKPVSAGANESINGLQNDDALQLIAAAKYEFDYATVNPYVYKEPIAPHIAAEKTNHPIMSGVLTQQLELLRSQHDVVVIEGAGGWQVPLNQQETFADWVKVLKCPVIIVVGLRVGCINHAVLSYLNIVDGPNKVVGWVANTVSKEVNNVSEIVDYIDGVIDAPLLGVVPFLNNTAHANEFIDFSLLQLPTAL